MMRFWHELVAALGDLIPGGVPTLGLILAVLTAVVALLWYWWPEWWRALVRGAARGRRRGERKPRRARFRGLWGRLRARWRLGWRRRRRGAPAQAEQEPELSPDELPDLPAVALVLSADELAAQGRYKEAVRERYRAIVRDLIERGVVDYRPGWTVTELAAMAARVRPATAPPLAGAGEIFSSIWYGQRDATAAHDAAMRVHADQIRVVLTERVPA